MGKSCVAIYGQLLSNQNSELLNYFEINNRNRRKIKRDGRPAIGQVQRCPEVRGRQERTGQISKIEEVWKTGSLRICATSPYSHSKEKEGKVNSNLLKAFPP